MYKGVVFDLDGTLVDSRLCFKTIRKQLGIPEGEWILEYLDTLPIDIRNAKLTELKEIEIEAAKKSVLFSGALNLIKELRKKGVRLGIFTRNCSAVTYYVVQSFGMAFDLIITRDDAPPKPDPTGLYRFLNEWKINSNELLFVGDTRADIDCGKRAKVKTALYTNGAIHKYDWRPDYVIADYSKFHLEIREPKWVVSKADPKE